MMNRQTFNPKDIEEILARKPSPENYKSKKSDLLEIAKSIGIGVIEIIKSLPTAACLLLSVIPTSYTKTKNNEDDSHSEKEGYRTGHSGFGYYDSNDKKLD